MAKQDGKRPLFTIRRFVMALLFFSGFLIIGIGGSYMAAGELVSGQIAAVYAVLALIGAVSVFFRLRWFALLFYIGCAIGWGVGWWVSGLNGAFAPTAGSICTVFLIAVFTLLGALEQGKVIRRRRERRRQEEIAAAAQAQEERNRAELAQARAAREAAEAALVQAAGQASAGPVEEQQAQKIQEET